MMAASSAGLEGIVGRTARARSQHRRCGAPGNGFFNTSTSLFILNLCVLGIACGDSGTITGGNGPGGSNPGGSNSGAGTPGGNNSGAGTPGGGGAGGGGAPSVGGQGQGGAQAICDEAVADIEAKFERCGIKTGGDDDGGGGNFGGGNFGGGGVGGGGQVECTDKNAVLAACVRDCIEAAPCGALDGSDKQAESDYADCVGGCL